MLNDAHTKELSLERVTKSNEDYKSQNVRLTKKQESKSLYLLSLETCIMLKILSLSSLLTLLQLIDVDVKLNILKAMVEKTVAFFYPNDSSIADRAPQLLDGLLIRSQEIILTNMKHSTSLMLGILKSLYPEPTWTRR
jgi:hypothetical protein